MTDCHVCGSGATRAIGGYEALRRVTSDCQPWPAGGSLLACETCGCVQKAIDAGWRAEVGRIYADYAIYHQSGGAEQAVFPRGDGGGVARSVVLLEKLMGSVTIPQQGRLFDVGCGNGSLLRAFREARPDWQLAGTDINPRHGAAVEAIAGPGSFYLQGDSVPGPFDIVSVIHALEHIPAPVAFLRSLASKLTSSGLLLIDVPSYVRNPFDLLVADHSSHFSEATLAHCLRLAGYRDVVPPGEWIAKEMTFVVRPAETGTGPSPAAAVSEVGARLHWLERLKSSAAALAAHGPLGIFGTSIAGTWLYSELDGAVAFFVDEDPSRRGRTYRGLPIFHPGDLADDQQVFVALPDWLARPVCDRLNGGRAVYHPPPPLES